MAGLSPLFCQVSTVVKSVTHFDAGVERKTTWSKVSCSRKHHNRMQKSIRPWSPDPLISELKWGSILGFLELISHAGMSENMLDLVKFYFMTVFAFVYCCSRSEVENVKLSLQTFHI